MIRKNPQNGEILWLIIIESIIGKMVTSVTRSPSTERVETKRKESVKRDLVRKGLRVKLKMMLPPPCYSERDTCQCAVLHSL